MKIKKAPVIVTILLMMLGSFTLGVHAAGTSKEITAYMRYDVGVQYNGEPVVMKNAKGEQVYPISYEGSTYVPIRAIGNLFGVPVEWDSDTKSVVLGARAEFQGIDLLDQFKSYSFSHGSKHVMKSDKLSKSIAGVPVDHWLSLKNGTPSVQPKADAYAYFNLGGNYSTLTFEVASNEDTVLHVYGDNETTLSEIPVKANQVPLKVSIPLLNSTQLHFQAELSKNTLNNDDSTLNIINAYLT